MPNPIERLVALVKQGNPKVLLGGAAVIGGGAGLYIYLKNRGQGGSLFGSPAAGAAGDAGAGGGGGGSGDSGLGGSATTGTDLGLGLPSLPDASIITDPGSVPLPALTATASPIDAGFGAQAFPSPLSYTGADYGNPIGTLPELPAASDVFATSGLGGGGSGIGGGGGGIGGFDQSAIATPPSPAVADQTVGFGAPHQVVSSPGAGYGTPHMLTAPTKADVNVGYGTPHDVGYGTPHNVGYGDPHLAVVQRQAADQVLQREAQNQLFTQERQAAAEQTSFMQQIYNRQRQQVEQEALQRVSIQNAEIQFGHALQQRQALVSNLQAESVSHFYDTIRQAQSGIDQSRSAQSAASNLNQPRQAQSQAVVQRTAQTTQLQPTRTAQNPVQPVQRRPGQPF